MAAMTAWQPPAPSPEYPAMRKPGMRGRVQQKHREPTVERVVARARSLAVELDPGPRELVMQMADLIEAMAKVRDDTYNTGAADALQWTADDRQPWDDLGDREVIRQRLSFVAKMHRVKVQHGRTKTSSR